MLTCVILNYNDYESVINLYNQISGYDVLDKIILVDGASTDDSYAELKQLENKKTVVLLAAKNGGYGYGNNIGIRYSLELGADYVLVANPDVNFSQESIQNCLNMIREHSECVAIAPCMQGIRRNRLAYKITSPIKDVMFSCMTLNRLFNPRYYSKSYFEDKSWCYVDAVPGSLVLFDAKKFAECGLYDENVFLYHEEMIIGKKFQSHNYKTILLLNSFYEHHHSVSVRKTFKSAWKIKKITLKSHKYYLTKYNDKKAVSKSFLNILTPILFLETLVWEKFKQ